MRSESITSTRSRVRIEVNGVGFGIAGFRKMENA
jgi:hypothetical protein